MNFNFRNIFVKRTEIPKGPVNTPDLFKLEQQEFHLLFAPKGVLKEPVVLQNVFTYPKFHVFLQNHEPGTPPVVLRANGEKNQIQRAKVKGDLHIASTERMLELDKERNNGVHSLRRTIPIIVGEVPDERGKLFENKPQLRHDVWFYTDNMEHWERQINFDYDLWRGRKNGGFIQAPIVLDPRYYIKRYYITPKRAATPRKFEVTLRSAEWHQMIKDYDHDLQEEENKKREAEPKDTGPRRFIHITTNGAEQTSTT